MLRCPNPYENIIKSDQNTWPSNVCHHLCLYWEKFVNLFIFLLENLLIREFKYFFPKKLFDKALGRN